MHENAARATVGSMRRTILTGVVGALLAGTYFLLLRRPVMTLGRDSRRRRMAGFPGDELLEDADGVATRAIDDRRAAGAVWPWLAQMGPSPRGGAYTYDWIENLLGLDMHSVDRVLPEFQHPAGRRHDRLRAEPDAARAGRAGARARLALRGRQLGLDVRARAERDGSTRLISRNRFRLPTLVARIGMLPMEPASLVMERKMLRGIKERAERLATTTG